MVVYINNGTDNVVSIVLYESGDPKDMSGVTRVRIIMDDVTGTAIDSDSITMTWADAVTFDSATTYPIQFVGSDAALSVGLYLDCRVVVYDAVNTDGIEWPELVSFVVR